MRTSLCEIQRRFYTASPVESMGLIQKVFKGGAHEGKTIKTLLQSETSIGALYRTSGAVHL